MSSYNVCSDRTVLDTAPWLCEEELDPGNAYIGVPYKYGKDPITHFWFGPFDPYVAEWLMGAIKNKQVGGNNL